MRLNLAKKITITVIGVLLLSVGSSIAALLSSWSVRILLQETVGENLPSVRAAEQVEVALLDQRGLMSAYMLDNGNHLWLNDLSTRERAFDVALARARATAQTTEEHAVLSKIESVYREYTGMRHHVLWLFDHGDEIQARSVALNEVNQLYKDAYGLCEEFIALNEGAMSSATQRAMTGVRNATIAVSTAVSITLILGLILLGLLFYGVLRPLRQMVYDAQQFANEGSSNNGKLPEDELRAVGVYLRTLMSDVVDTRSNLERSRSQLLNSEKLASLGKLASSVAHEIRNPLTAMRMWLYSIHRSLESDPEIDRKFEIVSGEISRLESIVRNFLEFSRPPALDRKPQSAAALIDKTLELFSHRLKERDLRVKRVIADGLPPIMGDREQLKQVLINLLDNAMSAAGPGGTITVSTQCDSNREGRDEVVIRIHDSGQGMPEDVRSRIFEPFFSTKEDGTGLGLCIAARIMTQHAGRLVLESSNERGTTFAVWIPTSSVAAHEPSVHR